MKRSSRGGASVIGALAATWAFPATAQTVTGGHSASAGFLLLMTERFEFTVAQLPTLGAQLLALPYLQVVGGALLLWIGIQLLGDQHEGEGEVKEYGSLMAAVRTILIADLVMSLDNVIAVAAAAKGSTTLLILGLAISIPLVIFGSTLMIRLMERFPIVVTFGAALIGWVGGETIISDNVLLSTVEGAHWLHYAGPAIGAAAVLGAGALLARRHPQTNPSAP